MTYQTQVKSSEPEADTEGGRSHAEGGLSHDLKIPNEAGVALVAGWSIDLLNDLMSGDHTSARLNMVNIEQAMERYFPEHSRAEAARWILVYIMMQIPIDEVLK